MSELSYFERRRIQMEYAVPLVNDLREILGDEVLVNALEELNRRRLQQACKEQDVNFSRMDEMVGYYAQGDAQGDALEYEVIASSSDQFDLDVHRCRYAEMMEELGGRDVGHLLVCSADYLSARQMGLTLTRTQTCMQGADRCDFRYRPDTRE